MSPAGIVRLVVAGIIIAVFLIYCFFEYEGGLFDCHTIGEGFVISTFVGIILCIVAALYCSFSSSYWNASMQYWDKATAVYLEEADRVVDEDKVQYDYVMQYKTLPAYKKYRYYYRELFPRTEPEKYSDTFTVSDEDLTTTGKITLVTVKGD